MLVKIEDLDEGREEDNCPLLVNSVRDLPKKINHILLINPKQYRQYMQSNSIQKIKITYNVSQYS